ncbi:ATP-binding cassette domain-containing protein, partial [Enterobacter hormaechei]|uniref:ATP-binding cassette domain-containing protein n=1 Tax=Enterobacter hormaechei TaxID=158836 RepID=UPI001953E1DF
MITIEHVDKWYGDYHALVDINETVAKGEVVVVCGPSGSGKSTTMNILGCLDVPSSGEFLFKGVHVEKLERDQR